jgi:hypothetical protein
MGEGMNMKKDGPGGEDELTEQEELTDAELGQASGGIVVTRSSDGLDKATSINTSGSLTKHDTVKPSISNVR